MAQAGTVWVDVRGNTTPLAMDIGKAAAAASALALVGLGAAAVRESTEFNKAISGVGAVANATAADLELLRKAALQAGADTAFSASDAAVAEAELAKAGLSTADVLGGALSGSLDLAAAGQLDLGAAATITAQALNVFNLEGDQASHVADVLAAGANKSATDVNQLGQALAQGGIVADQFGLGLEDTVGTLSLFADKTLVGSDAGTSFKTMLQRLVPQSAEAKQAMDDLGLSFFDSAGNFVGIAETAQQLQDALSGLSEEQRAGALTTLFGSDGIRAANILYTEGASGVREYTDAVNDTGAAQRMAAAQLDNLSGDLEALRGSWETVLIGLGSSADSGLRDIVQALTEGVNAVGEFVQSPVFDQVTTAVGGVLSSLAGGLTDAGDGLQRFLGDLDASDVSAFFDALRDGAEGLEGPLIGLSTALAAMSASKLPVIGGLIPGLSPLQGILAGIVLQSEEGRAALGSMFELGADAAVAFAPVVGAAADVLGVLADQGWLVRAALDVFLASKVVGTVTPWIDRLNGLSDAFQSLQQRGADIRLATTATSAEAAASSITHVAAASTAAGTGLAVMSSGLAVANAGFEQLALTSRTDFIDVPSWEVFDDVTARAALSAGDLGVAAQGAEGRLGSFGAKAGDVGRGGLDALKGKVGGLLSSLAGPAGLTAVIAGGLFVYQDWANEQRAVEDATRDLTSALLAQADVAASSQFAEILRAKLEDADLAEAFAETGLAPSTITALLDKNAAAFVEFADKVKDIQGTEAGFDDDPWTQYRNAAPPAIKPFLEDLIELRRDGKLSGDELLELIQVLGQLGTVVGASSINIGVLADMFAAEAESAELSADAQRDLATARDDNASIEDRRAALNRLTEAYPELASAAGFAADEIGNADRAMTEATTGAADLAGGLFDLSGIGEHMAEVVSGAMSGFAGATESAADGLLGLLDAQDATEDGAKRVADAEKNLADILSGNTEGVRNATDGLREANKALADARSETGPGSKASKDAARELREARSALRDAQIEAGREPEAGDFFEDKRDAVLDALDRVGEAQKKLDEINAGTSEQVVAASERVAEAERQLAEELAKTGPASQEARDAQEALSDAQRAGAKSAEDFGTALGTVAVEDIPATIAALQALRDQYGLNKEMVDALIGSLLIQAALLQQPPAPPAPAPAPPPSYPAPPQQVGAGRASGGNVWAGTAFPVNELGAPEMFSSATGGQFLLPNQAGSVTPMTDVVGAIQSMHRDLLRSTPSATAVTNDDVVRALGRTNQLLEALVADTARSGADVRRGAAAFA